MIQGHIDSVTRVQVVGWMHSNSIPLVGVHVVAFIDDERVGGGDIGIYREDLLRAGIGDGRGGFCFAIELAPSQDARSVEVRIQGGNLSLRQMDTAVISREERRSGPRRPPLAPESLSWMLSRGWLTPDQFAVLERLARFGVYKQPLLFAGDRSGPVWGQHLAGLTREHLQLHLNREVQLDWRENLWETDLIELRSYLHAQFPDVAPVVGLWAPSINCLNVAEGSHLETRTLPASSGVDYEFGNDHLLWLNLDTVFQAPTGGLTSPTTAFVPILSTANVERPQ